MKSDSAGQGGDNLGLGTSGCTSEYDLWPSLWPIYPLERPKRWDILVVQRIGCGARLSGQIPALPLTSSVTLGRLFHLSVPQVPHLQNGLNNCTYCTELLWE